jgi:hypothetical protein
MVLDGRQINGGKEMRKKKTGKSEAELEKEELEFLEKNSRDLEKSLTDFCKKYDLQFSPPYSNGESNEILSVARRREFEEIEMLFPGFSRYNEDMQINCKLVYKFGLDPKIVADRQKIMKGITHKLNTGTSDSSVNPDLYRFRKG